MDCVNKKNSRILCFVLLLISSSFICCQESEYDTQNKLLQDNENMIAWLCVPKEACWYYSKYTDKQLLDDYTEIIKCPPDGKRILCPPKIKGDLFCQGVKNLNGSECKFKSDCWHYQKTEKLPGYEHDIPCTLSDNKMCCAPKEERIARKKCNEYTKQIYEKLNVTSQHGKSPNCHISNPYIVRGMNAEKGEFPHMAAIGYMDDNKLNWWCGGSLISKKFVLSAATCVKNRTTPITVLLGAENYLSTHENMNAAYYTIVETFLHPKYDSNRVNNDIALFKLNDTVEFNAYIRPICLSTSSLFLPTHSTAVVSGYGVTNTGEKETGALMKANVTIFDNELCISTYKSYKIISDIDKDTILCAGSNGDNGKYVCNGDGGSPLQTLKGECLWEQHGIVSLGPYFCSDKKKPESVYTRVSYYIDWIESIVWSSNE